MSPTSLASHHAELDTNSNANVTNDTEYPGTASPVSHDAFAYRDGNDTMSPYNNNTLKLDNESLMMSQHLSDSKDEYMRDEPSGAAYGDQEQSAAVSRTGSHYKDNYETTFDLDGNVETKSICSAKSGGSGHDNRYGIIFCLEFLALKFFFRSTLHLRLLHFVLKMHKLKFLWMMR